MQLHTGAGGERASTPPFFVNDPPATQSQRELLLNFRQTVIDDPELVLGGIETYFGMSFGGPWDQAERIQRTDKFIELLVADDRMKKVINQLRLIIGSNMDITLMNFEGREAFFRTHERILDIDKPINANPQRAGLENQVGFVMLRRRLRLLSCLGLADLDKIEDFPRSPLS